MILSKFSSVATFSLLLLVGIHQSAFLNSASATTLGQNLIVNGDAEGGFCDRVGNAVGSDIPSISAWNVSRGFSVLCYNASGFEFVNPFGQTVRVSGLPSSNDPSLNDRGNNLFFGGAERDSSSAFQIIDLNSQQNLIDRSLLSYTLSGWLGGYGTDRDNVELSAIFVNEIGQNLGSLTLISPQPDQRGNSTGLFYRSRTGLIPVGTRQVNLLLAMNYVRGRVNDAYADNLSFVVTPVPEPCSVFGIGLALGFGSLFKNLKKPQRKQK